MSRRDEGTERFDGCGSPPVVHGHVSVLPACCWCVRAASLEAHVLSALDTLKTHLLQHPRHMSPACSCAEASFPASAPPSAAPPPPPPAPACTALPVFMHVYLEGTDEEDIKAESKILPVMHEGDKVQLEKLEAIQHFTQPPGRYKGTS